MVVKLETENIRVMALFEKVTKVHAKDCVINDHGVYFLVNPDKVGLAVGKEGVSVRELWRLLKKPVKVFGYYDDMEEFIRGVIPSIEDIQLNGDTVVLTVPLQDKTKVIGRNGSNIKIIKEILNRHFNIKHVKLR